jgi:hypothetical protein
MALTDMRGLLPSIADVPRDFSAQQNVASATDFRNRNVFPIVKSSICRKKKFFSVVKK